MTPTNPKEKQSSKQKSQNEEAKPAKPPTVLSTPSSSLNHKNSPNAAPLYPRPKFIPEVPYFREYMAILDAMTPEKRREWEEETDRLMEKYATDEIPNHPSDYISDATLSEKEKERLDREEKEEEREKRKGGKL